MLSKVATLTSVLFAASALVRADVVPSEPGPGSVYTAGQECTISWEGDRDSNTHWKDMSIQLMTGDNFDMIHITTVATGLDGTVSGRFNYPCPEVIPYSAIYFYQFTSPHTDLKTWATRFTITSPEGETVPPENENQPGTGAPIPWGVGALADPSAATAPPVIGGAANAASGSGLPEGSEVAAASASLGAEATPTVSNSPSGVSSSGSLRPTSPSASSSAGASEPSDTGAAVASSANVKLTLVAAVVSAVSLLFMA